MRWIAGGHTDCDTGQWDDCGYDDDGNWVGYDEGEDEDSWWQNTLEAIGDFLGLDGSFGYDGEAGREWIWEVWGSNLQDALDHLADSFNDWWGDSGQPSWNDFTRFMAGDIGPLVPTSDLDVENYGLGYDTHFTNYKDAIKQAFQSVWGDESIGNREVGGYVREGTDEYGNKYYFITEMGVGGPSNVNPGGADGEMLGNVVAIFHTHGMDSGDIGDYYFSPTDIRNANTAGVGGNSGLPTFMMTPDGNIYSYDPVTNNYYNPADNETLENIANVSVHEGHVNGN